VVRINRLEQINDILINGITFNLFLMMLCNYCSVLVVFVPVFMLTLL